MGDSTHSSPSFGSGDNSSATTGRFPGSNPEPRTGNMPGNSTGSNRDGTSAPNGRNRDGAAGSPGSPANAPGSGMGRQSGFGFEQRNR
jgi:hypothetical protein